LRWPLCEASAVSAPPTLTWMGDLHLHLPDPCALQRTIILSVPVQARKQIPRTCSFKVQLHVLFKKSHEGCLLRIRSIGAPVDYDAPFEMRIAREDSADVGEIAQFCMSEGSISGGRIALPERLVAAGAWPSAGTRLRDGRLD
jgi:hypothetical protein